MVGGRRGGREGEGEGWLRGNHALIETFYQGGGGGGEEEEGEGGGGMGGGAEEGGQGTVQTFPESSCQGKNVKIASPPLPHWVSCTLPPYNWLMCAKL